MKKSVKINDINWFKIIIDYDIILCVEGMVILCAVELQCGISNRRANTFSSLYFFIKTIHLYFFFVFICIFILLSRKSDQKLT